MTTATESESVDWQFAEDDVSFDAGRLRAELAYRQLQGKDFAALSGMNLMRLYEIMRGAQQPGELAKLKIARGLRRISVDPATVLVRAES